MTEPNWSTELPRYCTYCGRDMVSKFIKVKTFDSRTGRPNRHEYYWCCPKIGFWSFCGTMHDEFHVIEEPDHMIGKYSYRGVLTIYRSGI